MPPTSTSQAAPVGQRARLASGTAGCARARRCSAGRLPCISIARSRGQRACSPSAPSTREVEQVVVAQPRGPVGNARAHARAHRRRALAARRGGAGRSRSRRSRRARSGPAPRRGRWWSPGRRRTGRGRGGWAWARLEGAATGRGDATRARSSRRHQARQHLDLQHAHPGRHGGGTEVIGRRVSRFSSAPCENAARSRRSAPRCARRSAICSGVSCAHHLGRASRRSASCRGTPCPR